MKIVLIPLGAVLLVVGVSLLSLRTRDARSSAHVAAPSAMDDPARSGAFDMSSLEVPEVYGRDHAPAAVPSGPPTLPPSGSEGPAPQALEDPCHELRKERRGLLEKIAQLEIEVLHLRYPESDPFGAFLRSYEATQITDAEERKVIRATLEEVPVVLRPGEATWIVERSRDEGLQQIPDPEDLIRFLGPQRVLREVPPSWFHARHMQFYDEERWFNLFGTPKPSSTQGQGEAGR